MDQRLAANMRGLFTLYRRRCLHRHLRPQVLTTTIFILSHTNIINAAATNGNCKCQAAHHAITLRSTSSKRLSRFNLISTLSTQSANLHHHLGTTTMHVHSSATASGVTVGFKLPAASPSQYSRCNPTFQNFSQLPHCNS